MKGKRILVGISIVGLLLVLILGSGLAQEPEERAEPQGTYAIESVVRSRFTYQGLLREDGLPVTGTRDMVFQLFSEDACITPVGSIISLPGVEVEEGLFSVELSVSTSDVNGQGLWLGIQVEGTTIGCQEILPVPYALSLRPGARIEAAQENWDALHAVNTADMGESYGIYARSYSTLGRGVYGYASADSGLAYGVYGRSRSPGGAGVWAQGYDAGADLILAGNADTTLGDDGRIYSDYRYDSSDIHLLTNDGIRIDLDNDNNGEDADFEIRNADDTLILNVDESGAVSFGGPGIVSFPRPAYDSGWVNIAQGGEANRNHNLGGNAENYVVDLTCQSAGEGINNWGVGGDANWDEYYGAWYSNLTTTSITLHRWDEDTDCYNVRARIWVYP